MIKKFGNCYFIRKLMVKLIYFFIKKNFKKEKEEIGVFLFLSILIMFIRML